MELDVALIALLFLTGLGAGTVDAIAGGGGLITLPVLLTTGMSPVEALATNKLQGSFGTFAATRYFVKKKLVDLSQMRLMIGCTFAGAVLGTVLVQLLDTSLLATVMPLLLVLIALYFMLSPRISDQDSDQRVKPALFAFVSLAGFSLARATAHTKVLNFTSNIASLIFFALGGNIVWLAGMIMAAGQLIGGQLGAKMVVTNGTRLIRPLIVTVTLLMSDKLLSDQYGEQVIAWF